MDKIQKLEFWLYKRQASWRRQGRMWFPSPAEIRLIELMGGKVIKLPILKSPKTGFPLAYILSMGRLFREEKIKREVRVGPYYLDFGNDIKRGIEVDGAAYHQNIIYEYDREVFLYSKDWRLLRIKAGDVWRQPNLVQRQVIGFLYY